MKALIDGDMLLYRATLGAQEEVIFDNMHTRYSNFDRVLDVYESSLQEMLERTNCTEYEVAFSSDTNWRKEILPSYKENRKDALRPLGFDRLKELCLQDSQSRLIEGWEADDYMGVKATEEHDDWVIISHDKDFKTIPGEFYRLRDNELDHHIITPGQAVYNHFVQAFMGDRVDGYPGCPGVGIKTAEKLINQIVAIPGSVDLDESMEVWRMIVSKYEDKGLTVKDALVNGQVARILQVCDLHEGEYSQEAIILWNPALVPF